MAHIVRYFLPVLLVALGLVSASAQEIQPMHGAEYVKPDKGAAPAAEVRPPSLAMSLPQPVVAAIGSLTVEDMTRARGRAGVETVGVHRELPGAVVALSEEGGANRTSVAGAWAQTSIGPLWRLHIIARDAFAMRLHFHNFRVGEGRVWIHSDDGQVAGPYSGTGLFDDGDFWSDLIFGQSMTIEYVPAPGEPAGLSVPFELREISHIWRDPRLFEAGSPAPPWPSLDRNGTAGDLQSIRSADAAAAVAPQRAHAEGPRVEQAAPCHLDVMCSAEWAQTAHGVGLILFEFGDSTATCSGSLLNTRNSTFEPYFLTAAHCIKAESAARSVLSFWGFQSSSCNGAAPALRDVPRTTGGSRLLASLGDFGDSKGDMTLLEIFGELPGGVFFQGWTPTRQSMGARVTGVHHPRGAFKRISQGTIVPRRASFANDSTYATVALSAGRIETGSSGSAMFSAPGVVAGALSFGPKTDNACAVEPFNAGYTHFSTFYPNIQRFLENMGGQPPPPPNPPKVLLSGRAESFQFGPVPSARLFNGPDSFVLEVPAEAQRVTLTLRSENPSVDIDLFARFDADNSQAGDRFNTDYVSEGLDGNETLVIDRTSSPPLRSGALYVTIRLFSANAVSRGTLTATIDLAAPPPPPTGETLTSGRAVGFELPPVDGPTLFGGSSAYRIEVGQGATKLDVQVSTFTPGVDVDLHVRRGSPPAVSGGEILADFESVSLTGDELVTITPDNGLSPGTYFAALSVWTDNARSEGTIRADVLTGPAPDPGGARVLSSGEEARFDLPAVATPSFFSDVIFAVEVPANARRVVVDLITETPNADLDLFVRLGQPPVVQDRRVLANYESLGLTGLEQIVIDSESQPPLQAGRYYFGIAAYITGVATTGRVVATVELGQPQVQLGAVTHGASFAEDGFVAPGQIVSLFGSRMGPAEGIQPGLDGSGRLPTFVGGAIVLFGGLPAPLFFVQGGQINAQVPYGVAGRGLIDVVVVVDGVATNVRQVRVQDAAPGLFAFGDGSNRAIVVNSNNQLNSASNPARRGDFVTLYATGAGLTKGPNLEGAPAPSNPLALTRLPVRVRFGGVEQSPFFAGLAPSFAGLTQINIFVPANAPTGAAVPLTLFIGSFASGAQPTIAIE